MRNYGLASVSEFLGDLIVYRNLTPCDQRLPSYVDIQKILEDMPSSIPRKTDPAYARAVAYLLHLARALDSPKTSVNRLVFLGDTRLLDGTAFENLCQAGDWSGLAMICAEDNQPFSAELLQLTNNRWLLLSNRWSILKENASENPLGISFSHYCTQLNFPADASTVLLIDLDKTTLGARGRNATVIDQARQQAVLDTVAHLLGNGFDPTAFQLAHKTLSQPTYHKLTEDNQDYLAYICLILGAGLYILEDLVSQVEDTTIVNFGHFINEIEKRKVYMSQDLVKVHNEVNIHVQAGDPTPFKSFRYQEYRTTIERMGFLPDDTSISDLLGNEIVITQEVMQTALTWKDQGAVVFGLSDKPDEASLPTDSLASKGWLPLHKKRTHVVGE